MTEPETDLDAEVASEIGGMARGSAANLAAAAFNQVIGVVILLVITRALGRGEMGVYSQAVAIFTLLGLIALSGLRGALTRFVAVHRADNDAPALIGTVRLGTRLSVGAALVLAVALFVAAPWLADDVFHDGRLTAALRFVAVALPASAISDAALSVTQGFKSMRWFALIGLVLEPIVRLTVTGVSVAAGAGAEGPLAALVASQVVSAIAAVTVMRRMLRPWSSATPVYRPRELLVFSSATWAASLASTGLIWADVVLLGIYLPSADVGLYHAATRLVTLAVFVMLPINAAFAPRIADLSRRGRSHTLRRMYAVTTSWIIRLSLPAFVMLLVFPRPLLEFFGRGFAAAATVTIVLALGKFVDAATGPCGLILTMSGRPLLNAADLIVGLTLNIVLNIILIPRHGILGSAVAWAISLAVVNLARLAQVRAALGMLPFGTGAAKGIVAGAVAFVVALGARAVAPDTAGLIVGGIGVAVSYAAILLILRITEEDRAVLRLITSRV